MDRFISVYSRFMDALVKVCAVFVIASLAAMTGIMTYQTVLRYVFNTGTAWAEELVRAAFVFCVLLASGIAVRRNGHLRISAIEDRLHGRAKMVYRLAVHIICFIFYIYIFALSVKLCGSVRGKTSILLLQYKYLYLCIPIGTVVMMFASVERMMVEIRDMLAGKEGSR